jgi:hypothetical protein
MNDSKCYYNDTFSGNTSFISEHLIFVQSKDTSDSIKHVCGKSDNNGLSHDAQDTHPHVQLIP